MEDKVIRRYEAQGEQLIAQAKAIVIVDDATRETAAEFSTGARKAIKMVEDEFKPDINKAHQLHKDLLDRLKRLTEPFKQAQKIVDGEIQRDWLERERKRKEEERMAFIKAEAERKRQEEARLREAEEAIENGDLEEAEALLDSEVVVAPVVPIAPVAQTTQSSAGSTTVKRDIEVEVVDKQAVIMAVGDGKLPDMLLDVNVGAAKRYAKASGLTRMPGFRITETAVVSGRTR